MAVQRWLKTLRNPRLADHRTDTHKVGGISREPQDLTATAANTGDRSRELDRWVWADHAHTGMPSRIPSIPFATV